MTHKSALCIACLTMALSGCGGGAVGVRSNMGSSGQAPASSPGSGVPAAAGGSISISGGSSGVVVGLALGVFIIDGMSWAADRIRHAFGGGEVPESQSRPPPRRWVDSY